MVVKLLGRKMGGALGVAFYQRFVLKCCGHEKFLKLKSGLLMSCQGEATALGPTGTFRRLVGLISTSSRGCWPVKTKLFVTSPSIRHCCGRRRKYFVSISLASLQMQTTSQLPHVMLNTDGTTTATKPSFIVMAKARLNALADYRPL